MDPLTPKKPRSMPSLDDTTVSSPAAPDDGLVDTADLGIGERMTQQTSAVSLPSYELAPGMRLGEYQIEERIGHGGMGVVWSAVHPLIGKRAAIKILKKELCADPGSLERFIDEARVVNQIGHPNIVDVFAFGEMPDGRSYFVMEWLKGESLRARIARSRLHLDEVRAIVKPLARALQAAHDKGVIHRDLKPDNVFLVDVAEELPTAKLLDFGIAKLAKNDHRVEKTATGAIVGTPQYIAPEQAKGYAIDPRADIYALGAILFELLTGRPPFIADNAMEMVAKHLMEAPVRPSTIVRSIAPDLDDLVLRMLAKTPEGRPSLAEVVAVIERSRTSGRTVPIDRPTPPPERSGPYLAPAPLPTPQPVAAQPDRLTSLEMPAQQRPRWLVPALIGVPIAGVIAFLLVRSLGSTDEKPTQPPPIAATPTEPEPAKGAPPPEVKPPEATPPEAKPPEVTPEKTTLKTGTLRLDVTPARATILVDGAPYTTDMQLGYGTHRVEIRAKGMQPKELTIGIAAPATTKRVALVPLKETAKQRDPLDPGFTIPDGDGLATPRKN